MWIERQISKELESLARSFPVLVLVGPRQVGKTALLERTFDRYEYVALDVPSYAEMAETRPEDFLRRFPPPVILDEIQYAPAVFRHVKSTIDRRRENGLFVLTGSQNYPLMQEVSDSLAGRAAVIPFLGLSGSEWAAVEEFRQAYGWPEFLWRGGYPALWAELEAAPPRDRWYQGYLATYLERDVRSLLNVGSLRDFERFLRACAARTAQTLNLADLARDVGVSHSTSREWLSVLQASGQVVLLEPYHRSLGKRLIKAPKLYLTDSGLAAFLLGFSSAEALWRSPSAGPLFETYVVCQWLRWRDWSSPSTALWYWRDQSGNEVDLLLERDGRLIAVECKLTQTPTPRDLRGLRQLVAFYGEEMVESRFVACTTELPFDVEEGVTAVPGWTTWELSPGRGSPGTAEAVTSEAPDG